MFSAPRDHDVRRMLEELQSSRLAVAAMVQARAVPLCVVADEVAALRDELISNARKAADAHAADRGPATLTVIELALTQAARECERVRAFTHDVIAAMLAIVGVILGWCEFLISGGRAGPSQFPATS